MEKLDSLNRTSNGLRSGLFRRIKLLTLLASILILLPPPYKANAQDARVTINMNNATLVQVFQRLESLSPYTFVYRNDDLAGKGSVNVNFRNEPVRNILNNVLSGKGLGYSFSDNRIVISASTGAPLTRYRITGKVTDENGTALAGVTIRVKGKNVGQATDARGDYLLDFQDSERPTLVYSYVGYTTQEIPVSSSQNLDITLQTEITDVGTVVVQGAFVKQPDSFIGSATVITQKEIRENYSRNLLQTLGNLDPGLRIIESNQYGNNPNRVPEFQLRGQSSFNTAGDLSTQSRYNTVQDARAALNMPLFIIDELEVDIEEVMSLNDYDIETITVLKDAGATAQYGSRGANGVIVITTIRPQEGQLRVTYSGSLKLEFPDFSYFDEYLGSVEKLELEHSLGVWPDYYSATYDALLAGAKERGVNTEWHKIPTRTSIAQRHSFNVMGGNQDFRYGAMIDYNQTKGTMKGSDRNVLVGTMKLDYSKNGLRVGNYLSITQTNSHESEYGDYSQYTKMNSYWEPYAQDGSLNEYYYHPLNVNDSGQPVAIDNPMYNAAIGNWNKAGNTSIRNSTSLGYTIRPGFRARAGFSIGYTTSFSKDFYSPESYNFAQSSPEQKGRLTEKVGRTNNWSANAGLDYTETFNQKHMITAGVLYDIQETTKDQSNYSSTGFTTRDMGHPSLATAYPANGVPLGEEETTRRIGISGTFNYFYDQRYFVDATFRTDGSSSYGSESRWGQFYTAGGGWMASNEEFIQDALPFVSRMRFAYAYGVSGTMNFAPYDAMDVYNLALNSDYLYMGNYAGFLGSFANPNLKWQNTFTHNITAEFEFFEGRLGIKYEYYLKNTNNTVTDVDLSPSHGFEQYKANLGKIRNQGHDVTFNIRLLQDRVRNINWTINGKFGRNKNTVVKLSDAFKRQLEQVSVLSSGDDFWKYREGQSMDAQYVLVSAGVDPLTGNRLYVQQDGSLAFSGNQLDMIYWGNKLPKIDGYFSTNFQYKGLSINIGFSAKFGGYSVNYTLLNRLENVDLVYKVHKDALRYKWMQPGDVARYKQFYDRTGKSPQTLTYTSDFVQKENVLECTNINIFYTLPENWVNRNLHLGSVSFNVQLSNMFRFSTIKRERGTYYPFSRNPMFGLSIGF